MVAVFLSLLVIMTYQYFGIVKNVPQKQSLETTVERETFAPEMEVEKKKTIPKSALEKFVHQQSQQDLKKITIETPLFKGILTNQGARLESWQLKEFKDKNGEELELVVKPETAVMHYPLEFRFKDKELENSFNFGIYDIVGADLILSEIRPEGKVQFSYVNPQGIKVDKIYTFYYDSYKVDLEVWMESLSDSYLPPNYFLTWGPGFGKKEEKADRYSYIGPLTFVNNKLVKNKVKKIVDTVYHEGAIPWVSLSNKYFMAALISEKASSASVIEKDENDLVTIGLKNSDSEVLNERKGISQRFVLYFGPKKYEVLKEFNIRLEDNIDFGWFGWLGKPLFVVLKFFYRYIPSYGIAIILLTILIKIVFIPLTHSSYKSMKGMQQLQPEMQMLRKKYKDDPPKMNQEVMLLYKRHKVNPLGGCLPMLVQIPVFFALYRVLLGAIELRGASFLYLPDLSAKDPYYISPILMGLTMFIQQKMTPTSGDPKQKQLMMFMPIIFTIMFLNFPTGLVIYFLFSNLLTIAQQYYINRTP